MKAFDLAKAAVLQKEVDAWDNLTRILARYFVEDKQGFTFRAGSLYEACCQFYYQHSIRTQKAPSSPGGDHRPHVNHRGRIKVKRITQILSSLMVEKDRREKELRKLPVDVREKIVFGRTVCFRPFCTREFYGLGNVTRKFWLKEEDQKQAREHVILSFCSLNCANFSLDNVIE